MQGPELKFSTDTTSQDFAPLPQVHFTQMIRVEQKRAERSGKSFVLMLLEFGSSITAAPQERALEGTLASLSYSTRETDVKGWYKDGSVFGIIFTEIVHAEAKSIADVLLRRVRGLLAAALKPYESQIKITLEIFPQVWDSNDTNRLPGSTLPVEFREDRPGSRTDFKLKRAVDIVGSLVAITLFSPLFAAIAVAIKLTSRGPVLFRQRRVGRYGEEFEFVKFRSMYQGNDYAIHREYVKDLIAGAAGTQESGRPVIFKLTNDPRITAIGRFLRRTSLDELPQFFNVLKGEMSLVGPRPPIPYEVEQYQEWHKRRVRTVKPGITGLWQVKGRSRTTFDEMVRLDLEYARTWSLWLDFKILLETPGAMISGDGAH